MSKEQLNSENIELIDQFYRLLINWHTQRFLEALKGYSDLKGNAVNNEMNCYFASELDPNDEDYFGDTGVAFYVDYPDVEEEGIIVLTNREFYDILINKCNDYLQIESGHQNEVQTLLNIIKRKLNV
jgi:hypothetical protein